MLSAKQFAVALVTCVLLVGQVENKSSYGVGRRRKGDQLLVKDVLEARSAGIELTPTVTFNYAVEEHITHIEILSEENVFADINFSTEDNIVRGTVKGINDSSAPTSFEVMVYIYGFNATSELADSPHIINRNRHYDGVLTPDDDDDDEDDEAADDDESDYDEDISYDIDDDKLDEMSEATPEINSDFEKTDRTIELGQRQKGDYLIYHTYQTSVDSSDKPTNHSVIFYFIDNAYITCVRFVVVGSYDEDANAAQRIPPSAEYTHFTEHTLKAVVTEHNTTVMLAEMQLYGYRPDDLPAQYVPFPATFRRSGLEEHGLDDVLAPSATMSAIQRLRMVLQSSVAPRSHDADDNDDNDDDDNDNDDNNDDNNGKDDNGNGGKDDDDDDDDDNDDDDDDSETNTASGESISAIFPVQCSTGASAMSTPSIKSLWPAGMMIFLMHLRR